MSDLPDGWEWTTLGEVAVSVKNGIFVSRPGVEPNGVPILRISSVRSLSLKLDDVRYSAMSESDLNAQDSLLNAGDLLFTRYSGTAEYVGVCAMVPAGIGALTYPDKLIRVRLPQQYIDPRYVALAFASPLVRGKLHAKLRTTAGQIGISGSSLKDVPFPVSPLAEQRRVVAVLEGHLSRLDAGMRQIERAAGQFSLLMRSMLASIRQEALDRGAELKSIGQVAQTCLGKMLDGKKQDGEPTPYLRNINVRWGKVDVSDVSMIRLTPEERERFSLESGDLLVCEGGEPGRSAIWRGAEGVMSFQKALHRIRPNPTVSVEWLALMLEEYVRNGRAGNLFTGSTIKHLPQEKLRSIPVPVPDLMIQHELVRRADELQSMELKIQDEIRLATIRSGLLYRTLLTDAFSGQLVPQESSDEPAPVLLQQIKAVQGSKSSASRSLRTPKGTKNSKSV